MRVQPKPSRHRKRSGKTEDETTLRRLKVVALVSAVFGAGAWVAVSWDRWGAPQAEKVVTVYGLHTCACAFKWARSLESAGYTVQLFEPEDLQLPRGSLHTPPPLQGCHVARYLDYFLEGDIPTEVLHRLAAERPAAKGVFMESHATQVTANADAHDILLVDESGRFRHWFTWVHQFPVSDKSTSI